MGQREISPKWEIHSIAGLSQINYITLHFKELEKEQQTKPKMSKRKEIIKIRAEINERV